MITIRLKGEKKCRLQWWIFVVLSPSVFFASGCSRVGAPPEPPAPVAEQRSRVETPAADDITGLYEGNLVVGDDLLPGVLQIVANGRDLELILDLDEVMNAVGDGRYDDGVLTAALFYGEEGCPGELSFTGRMVEAGEWLSGDFRARDCTGEMSGRFSFQPSG